MAAKTLFMLTVVLDVSARSNSMAAMSQIMQDSEFCVQFREKTDEDEAYLYIFHGDG